MAEGATLLARTCHVVGSLDALREATGESDAAAAVSALSDSSIDALVERLLAEPPDASVPPQQHEVWPVLNARMSTFATGGGSTWFTATSGPAGINLMAAIDPRDSGSGRFPNGVLRALLYCHGLVLEDPLAIAADLVSGTDGSLREMARPAVRAAAASLAEIAPLLDAGVVQTYFVPTSRRVAPPAMAAAGAQSFGVTNTDEIWDAFEAAFVDGLGPELQELWRRIRGGDRSPSLELVEQASSGPDRDVIEVFLHVLGDLRPSAVVDNALAIVAESLHDLSRLGGHFDLLCPTPLFARLALSGNPVDDMRLFELVRTEVPGIEQLLVEDAVAIRGNSEAFAVWRARLSTGLEHARSARQELGPEVDVIPIVAEVLAEARAGLWQEVERSRSLSGRRRLTLAFTAGALSGSVGNSSGGVTAAAIGAVGGVLGAILGGLLTLGDVPTGYMRRHYVLFER